MSKKRSVKDPEIQECDDLLAEIRRLKQMTLDYIHVMRDAGVPKSRIEPYERAYASYLMHEWEVTSLRKILIAKITVNRRVKGE